MELASRGSFPAFRVSLILFFIPPGYVTDDCFFLLLHTVILVELSHLYLFLSYLLVVIQSTST